MTTPLFRLVAASAIFSFPALAQTASMGFSGRHMMGIPVTGAPYTAQRVSEHVQIGSDGTRFTSTNQRETIYRDSQGRVRTERVVMTGPNPQPPGGPLLVEIQDPVAHFTYIFDTQNKVVHRLALTVATPNTPRLARAADPPPPGFEARPRPQNAGEDLGQQVIEGVMAEGHRTVHTWPAGSMDNDRPFQTATETWYSPDLHEMLVSKNMDPRSGENSTRLININRAEPPADLFVPPADYPVVEETGNFQIHWTTARQ